LKTPQAEGLGQTIDDAELEDAKGKAIGTKL
jgi:hypothetical protein